MYIQSFSDFLFWEAQDIPRQFPSDKKRKRPELIPSERCRDGDEVVRTTVKA